jgi:hypothetical protein
MAQAMPNAAARSHYAAERYESFGDPGWPPVLLTG